MYNTCDISLDVGVLVSNHLNAAKRCNCVGVCNAIDTTSLRCECISICGVKRNIWLRFIECQPACNRYMNFIASFIALLLSFVHLLIIKDYFRCSKLKHVLWIPANLRRIHSILKDVLCMLKSPSHWYIKQRMGWIVTICEFTIKTGVIVKVIAGCREDPLSSNLFTSIY